MTSVAGTGDQHDGDEGHQDDDEIQGGAGHAASSEREGRSIAKSKVRAAPRGSCPFSHRHTVERFTPTASASCCCVHPLDSRIAFTLTAVMTVICVMHIISSSRNAHREHAKCIMPFDDRPEAAKRLERARIARGFATAKDAARRFGWTYETYIQHEQGTRGLPRAAKKYADAFRVSEGWLLTGEGGDNLTVRLVGAIGAGEQIYAVDDEAMGGGEELSAPPGVGPNAVAVRVRGESMFPDFDDGDILVYDRRYEADFEQFLRKRVIVGLPDGRRYVKRLYRGSQPGLWTLRSSNPRELDIEDVQIEWVAPVAWVKPAL